VPPVIRKLRLFCSKADFRDYAQISYSAKDKQARFNGRHCGYDFCLFNCGVDLLSRYPVLIINRNDFPEILIFLRQVKRR